MGLTRLPHSQSLRPAPHCSLRPRPRAYRESPRVPLPHPPVKGARQQGAAPSAPRPRAARTWPGRRPCCRQNARSHACSCVRTSRSRSMLLHGLRARRPVNLPPRGRRQPAANGGTWRVQRRGVGAGQPISGVLDGRPMGGDDVIAARGCAGRGAAHGEAGLSVVEAAAGPASTGRLLGTEWDGVHSRLC